jgi:hypothetical protein
MLQECLKILKFVIKILTFLMSFKSTLYAFYFQKPCRVYTGFFFSVGQFTNTSTLFFLNVTKRQESVIKNTGQGEIIIQDLDVTTR